MFWIIFTIIVLLLAYLGDESVTKVKNTRILARAMLVFVLAYVIAFWTEGTDRVEYVSFYNNDLKFNGLKDLIQLLSLQTRDMEPGFWLLAKTCSIIGLSGVGFLFVVALITNSLAVNVFYRFKFPVLVFFLYIMSLCYMQQANLTRQILAVFIGLYAIKYIIRKEWVKYLLFIFVAFTIHKTALALLLAVPIAFLKDEKSKAFQIVMFAAWIGSLATIFLHIPLLEKFSYLFIDTRYVAYADEEVTLGISNVKLDLVANSFVALYFFFTKDEGKINKAYIFLFIMACVVENLAFGARLLMRLALYFTPMICAVVPTLAMENKLVQSTETNKKSKNQLGFVFQAFVFLFYFRVLVLVRIVGGVEGFGEKVNSIFDIF